MTQQSTRFTAPTHCRLSIPSRQLSAWDEWPTTDARRAASPAAARPRQRTVRHGSRAGAGRRSVPASCQLLSCTFSLGPAGRSAPAAGYRTSRARRPSESDSEGKALPHHLLVTPIRGRRSVDSDSTSTRFPTFSSMALPPTRLIKGDTTNRRVPHSRRDNGHPRGQLGRPSRARAPMRRPENEARHVWPGAREFCAASGAARLPGAGETTASLAERARRRPLAALPGTMAAAMPEHVRSAVCSRPISPSATAAARSPSTVMSSA